MSDETNTSTAAENQAAAPEVEAQSAPAVPDATPLPEAAPAPAAPQPAAPVHQGPIQTGVVHKPITGE